MRIIGVDPGIGRLGWGIIEKNKGKVTVIAYGCVETQVNSNLTDRLVILFAKIQEILEKFQPEEMAIEELFFSKNVKTAFAVGQARGVILLAAAQQHLTISAYTPSAVKSAVAGYGKADKKQIGQMVKLTLKLTKIPTPDDTADALAIALTHIYTKKYD